MTREKSKKADAPAAPEHPQEERPRIHVVDRRFWVREDEDEDEGGPGKPTYVEELEGRIHELEATLETIRAQHRRAKSEFEEARARLRREMRREVERHRRDVFAGLLEILDDLDRALGAATETRDVDGLIRGVEMVRDAFLARLGEYGVVRRQSQGELFDPTRHEAVSTVPVEREEDHDRVVGVIKEGYDIGDEVLRPATVAVGKHHRAA